MALDYIQPTSAKATSYYLNNASYAPELAFNPTKSLTGTPVGTSWMSSLSGLAKLNAAFDEPRILRKVIINNGHHTGSANAPWLKMGVKTAVLYGTNSLNAYNNVTYTNLAELTELKSFQVEQHVSADIADPQTFDLPTNFQSFQYYVFRFADNWGYTDARQLVREIDMYFLAPTAGGLTYHKQNGLWVPISNPKVKVGGAWKEAERSYLKQDGSWLLRVYERPTVTSASAWQQVTSADKATDPNTSLIGGYTNTQWMGPHTALTNINFTMTFAESMQLTRMVINNAHQSGGATNQGIKDCVLRGANSSDFSDSVDLLAWQQPQHKAANEPDPVDVPLPAITEKFMYYRIFIKNAWGATNFLGIRQIDMYFHK